MNATAIGTRANASGANSVSLGADSVSSGARSVAIGFGASATLANQFAFGTNVTIYTLPGLGVGGASRGNANQSGDVQFVTTDDQGNLGTTTTPPSGKTSAPSGSTKGTTQGTTQGTTKTAYSEPVSSSSSPVASQPPQIEEASLDTSTTSVSNLGESVPLTETAQPTDVSPDTIGTNLGVAPANPPRILPESSFASLQAVGLNSQAISVNSEAIDVNTRAIAANRVLIDQAFAGIGENATACLLYTSPSPRDLSTSRMPSSA